jgi:hypothetical protein
MKLQSPLDLGIRHKQAKRIAEWQAAGASTAVIHSTVELRSKLPPFKPANTHTTASASPAA